MNLRFDQLLERVPADLRLRIESLKTTQQRADHHPEGNVFNHTKIVVNRLSRYNDINLSLAGLFHDIGKDITTKPNEEGILQALGHEDVSADLATRHSGWIAQEGGHPNIVIELVKFHMRVKLFDIMKLSKQMEMRRLASFGLLQVFTVADSMKTLTDHELRSVGLGSERVFQCCHGSTLDKACTKPVCNCPRT